MTVEDCIDEIFERPPELGITLALVVMQAGNVVAERYGVSPDTPFGSGGPVDGDTKLVSWSTAKSITHAAVGAPRIASTCCSAGVRKSLTAQLHELVLAC